MAELDARRGRHVSFLARSILGFLIAPPFFGIALSTLSLVVPPPLEATRAILLSAFIGYPMVAILCVPVFLLLTRQGLTGGFTYLWAAAFMALLIVLLIVVAPVVIEERGLAMLTAPAQLAEIGMLTVACFLATAVFWLIARPDRRSTSA